MLKKCVCQTSIPSRRLHAQLYEGRGYATRARFLGYTQPREINTEAEEGVGDITHSLLTVV